MVLSEPTGDYGQQNATITCVSSCAEGNGTAEDNLNYEDCLKGCLASATITPATTAAPAAASTGDPESSGTESADPKTTEASATSSGGEHISLFASLYPRLMLNVVFQAIRLVHPALRLITFPKAQVISSVLGSLSLELLGCLPQYSLCSRLLYNNFG